MGEGMRVEHWWGENEEVDTEKLGGWTPVSVPLSPPRIPYRPIYDLNSAAPVEA